MLFLEALGLLAAHILSWVAVCHALLTKRDPRSALGWTVTALLLPVLGPLLYVLFGISRAQSRAEKIMRQRVAQQPEYAYPACPASPSELVPEHIVRMAHLGRGLTDQPLCGGNALSPLRNGDEAYPAMLDAIAQARDHVFLVTYIFNAGQTGTAFIEALTAAAARGVDVRVTLPARNNLPYVHWATFRLLPTLLDAGVRVWHQPPPFAHTKLLAVDGYYSQIGSANLDARSLRLNFELNMEVFDPAFHDLLAAHMDDAVNRSREVTLADLAGQSLPVRLRNAACWIFSPYL